MGFGRQLNCWSLRCSWSIACWRCSNYIFLLHLTLGFNILRKDNFKPRRETFKFCNLVCLILEILRYCVVFLSMPGVVSRSGGHFKNNYELLNLRALKKNVSFNVWVRYFVWNFKGSLLNSMQNILPIHWKMCIFLFAGENLRAIGFKSS